MSTPDKKDLISAGKIIGVHGIKGDVKIISFLEKPENFNLYKNFYLKSEKLEMKIKFINKNVLVASINNIKTREDAEKLSGTEIFLNRNELPELESDEFYYSDLIGLKIIDAASKKEIGELLSVENYGAGDLFEIKFNDPKKKPKLFAFTKHAFPLINVKDGLIEANFPEEDFAAQEPEEEPSA